MANGRRGKNNGAGSDDGGAGVEFGTAGSEGSILEGIGRTSDSSGAPAHGHEHAGGVGSETSQGGAVSGGGNKNRAGSDRPEGGEGRNASNAPPPPPVIDIPETPFSQNEAPSFEVTETLGEEPPLSKYQQRKRRREERERQAEIGLQGVTSSFDAEVTASMIVDTLSNFASALVDERAGMTDTERNAMKDPLARSITRFSPSLASALSKYADPVALVIAFGLWANRVRIVSTERQPAPSIHSAPPPEEAELQAESIPYEVSEETGATPIPEVLHQYMRSPV